MIVVDSFIKFLSFEKRYSPHTVTSYQNDIKQFIRYFESLYGEIRWSEISHLHIRSWMVDLVQKNMGNRTIARKISSLQTFFKYLMKKGQIG